MEPTREQMLGFDDREVEIVPVPEWGTDAEVRVQGLTAEERDKFEMENARAQLGIKNEEKRLEARLRNIRARLVVRCVIDENGQRKFSDNDAAAVGRKSGAAVARIYLVAERLSGFAPADAEELAEAFVSAQDDDSSSE